MVCDGCDWTADRKSGAFSSVGLAVKSLACCVVTFHAESRHGLLTVMCWLLRVVRVVCDGCDWIAGGKSGAFSSVGLAMKSLA